MKKEEILEKSRAENKKKDIYQLEIEATATQVGGAIAIVITVIIFLTEWIISGLTNFGFYIVIAAFNGGCYTYQAIKRADKKFFYYFTGITWLIVAILYSILYILDLLS